MTIDGDEIALEIRLYREGDEPAVIELLSNEFSGRSAERLRWQYLGSPDTRRLFLGFADGVLARLLGDASFPGFVDGEPATIGLCGDWISRKGLGGRALAVLVATPFFQGLEAHDICLGFPREKAVVVAMVRYQARPLGTVPQWVRWHRGSAVRASNDRIPAPLAALVPVAVGALASVGRLGRRAAAVREVTELDGARRDGLDALAERARSIAALIRRRDAAYLQWRWLDQPSRPWRMAVANDGVGALAGMIVYGLDLEQPDLGRIVDLLALDPSTTTALVAHAAGQLAQAGAAKTVCELIDGRPWTAGAMRRAGFLERGIGPEMIALPTPRGAIDGEPGSFYLTFGDTDLC